MERNLVSLRNLKIICVACTIVALSPYLKTKKERVMFKANIVINNLN